MRSTHAWALSYPLSPGAAPEPLQVARLRHTHLGASRLAASAAPPLSTARRPGWSASRTGCKAAYAWHGCALCAPVFKVQRQAQHRMGAWEASY